jgi:hypothetical protein
MKSTIKLGLSALAISLTALAPAASALETVELNKTHVLRLPAPASAVVIGNPKIADVSVHSDNTLFLLGRGYGETDILILDAQGNTILHTDIRVIGSQASGNVSLIIPGEGRNTYNCTPYCRPAPIIGDNPTFITKYESAVHASANGPAILSAAPTPMTGGPGAGLAQGLMGGASIMGAASGSRQFDPVMQMGSDNAH